MRTGPIVEVELSATRADLDGSPALVFSARDLTEKKALMARLAASDRLASVGTLAAGVAHEINNPVAFVQANLNLLSEELPALLDRPEGARLDRAQVREALRDAMDGVQRIRSVVRDLQSVTRPRDLPAGPSDVHDVLRCALRLAATEGSGRI